MALKKTVSWASLATRGVDITKRASTVLFLKNSRTETHIWIGSVTPNLRRWKPKASVYDDEE